MEIKNFIEIAENLDWNVEEDGNGIVLSKCSPCGNDFSITLNKDSFVKELLKEIDNYDVSYEAYLWLDSSGHGKNGAPYDMKDVYEDMESNLKNMEELYEEYISIKNSVDNIKFELFMGCFGNGTLVCNKAVMEYGDYKKVAHIAECGKINWYVSCETIPPDALLKIEHCANVYYEKWKAELDKMPLIKQYEYFLDRVHLKTFLDVCDMKENSLEEKVKYLRKEYWKIVL